MRHERAQAPPLLDLASLCRDSDKVRTVVSIILDYERHEWIRLGQCRLRERENNRKGIWELAAYLQNATDFEHDSAFVLTLELVGVEFTGIEYGQTTFTGWIKSDDPEDFRVPNPGYDPLKHPKTETCKEKHCRKDNAHVIVPEGFYLPPPNPELLTLVAGRKVEVVTGIKKWKDE